METEKANSLFMVLFFAHSHLGLSKVCSYKIVAISGYDVLSFPPVKPLPPSYGDTSSITVSIPPNKHFNLTITEYNGYGNTSTTVVISEPILNREDTV